jgi:hypothetical protein
VEPVAGRAGAAAVALAERTGCSDDIPGADGRAVERRFGHDDPQRAAAVVDRDAEPITELRRSGGNCSGHGESHAFERFVGGPGLRNDRRG